MAKLWVCTNCETADYPKRHTRGSIVIEIVLWLSFIVPGVVYSLWRLTTKTKICKHCRSPQLVPFDSPAGRRITGR